MLTQAQVKKPKAQPNRIKKRLIDLGLTITDLAEELGHPRSTVSQAINQGRYPVVLGKVNERLFQTARLKAARHV